MLNLLTNNIKEDIRTRNNSGTIRTNPSRTTYRKYGTHKEIKNRKRHPSSIHSGNQVTNTDGKKAEVFSQKMQNQINSTRETDNETKTFSDLIKSLERKKHDHLAAKI